MLIWRLSIVNRSRFKIGYIKYYKRKFTKIDRCSWLVAFLFVVCKVFGSLLHHIRSWIGVSGVDSHNISEHFFLLTHYTGHSKARRSFLQLFWLMCVWLLWSERNNRISNNIETPILQLLDHVKFRSLWWLKANNATFVHGSQRWWSDPLLCLGLDWSFYLVYTL